MPTTLDVPIIKDGYSLPCDVPDELTICEEDAAPPGCGMLRILTKEDGDKRVVWNRAILQEIVAAKKMFVDLVKKGLVPYRVGTDGAATSEVMDEFDPEAEEVIFLPVALVRGG